jgi:HIRAN domain
MANWIESASEPTCLFLAWQPPDHVADRFRWAVGILERTGVGDCSLRYLSPGEEFEAHNQGRRFDAICKLGYEGYPAFPLKKNRYSTGVLPALMRRLPPPSRPDFAEYKRQFRLPPNLFVTNFALLGRTEAKLPGDGFSIVDPFDGSTANCDLMLEIAGYRYYAEQTVLSLGDPVSIESEPDNEHDPSAVLVRAAGCKIGNINRLQALAFRRWLAERQVTAVVERLNGRPGKPRAFIFVRVRPV